MSILTQILIIGLFCNGLKLASEEGMIFYKPARKVLSWPEWINKPIIGCIYCMASVWGSLVFLALNHNNLSGTIINLPIVVVASVFVNGSLYELLALLQEATRKLYNDNVSKDN